MSLTIVLPWPPRQLSPNARLGWKAKHRYRHSYKHTCSWVCARVRKLEAERVKATITFCPPDNRRRDLDNMLASSKAGLDAVSEAIGVDDSRWSLSIQRADPVRDGEVRITIEVEA